MTKKCRYFMFAGILAACVGISLGMLALMPIDERPGVTRANFDRIQEGMTLQEIEQIFGRPGTYTWGGYFWQADDGVSVFVVFNCNGDSAGHKRWEDSTESPLDKLRRWLQFPK